MHIQAISNIANIVPCILSYLQPTPTTPSHPTSPHTLTPTALSFTPRHAHAHSLTNTSSPRLFLHDSTSPNTFTSSSSSSSVNGNVSNFSISGDISVFNDHTELVIRTSPTIIRRPRQRPPHMLSWAHAARARRKRLREAYLNTSTTTTTTTTSSSSSSSSEEAANNIEIWSAPDFDLEGSDGGWEDVEVLAPDMRDRQTVITLAKMTSNAYTLPEASDWYPLGDEWNASVPVGWEPEADGLRGHIFADKTNSTVIIAIKGTSAGILGSGGPTAKNDKFNDNLMFSCCCARVDFSWSPVCDCYAGGYRCEETCLEDALISESVYTTVGTNLYNNVTYMYPDANIWLVGHSLGGALSALISLSFGAPAVGFESPGDRLPARRLHLPLPPGMPSDKTGITHVYHTADPIPQGVCTGAYSGCYAAGFALESKCHVGQTILYDTVTVKGWSVDIRTHSITQVIEKVLTDPWPGTDELSDIQLSHSSGQRGGRTQESSWTSWWGWGRRGPGKNKGGENGDDDDDQTGGGWEKHGGVPKPQPEDDCVDCFKWEFGDGWDQGVVE